MSHLSLCLLLLGTYGFTSTHRGPGHHGMGDDDDCHDHPTEAPGYWSYQKVSGSNTNFAFQLFQEMFSEAGDKNVFLSPLGISIAFALLSLGAKTRTQSQLLSGLGFDQAEISEQEMHDGFRYLLQMVNRAKAELELNIGNALFTHDHVELLETFVNDAENYYQAEILPVDFKNSPEAEKQINSYIENKTHIKDAIKCLSPDTVMVLVNCVFFKAYWKKTFNYEATREADFFVDEQTTVKVPMMNKDTRFKTYYDTQLFCRVVELPYKGGASALFILPDQGKLRQVEQVLGKDRLLKWSASLKERRINLYLPKFSTSGSYDVKKLLQKMGVTDLFEDYADLSGITRNSLLKVSKAVHKSFLNVHENGTEAAATSLMEIVPYSLPLVIIFNRPFITVITSRDDILFLGGIRNPTTI